MSARPQEAAAVPIPDATLPNEVQKAFSANLSVRSNVGRLLAALNLSPLRGDQQGGAAGQAAKQHCGLFKQETDDTRVPAGHDDFWPEPSRQPGTGVAALGEDAGQQQRDQQWAKQAASGQRVGAGIDRDRVKIAVMAVRADIKKLEAIVAKLSQRQTASLKVNARTISADHLLMERCLGADSAEADSDLLTILMERFASTSAARDLASTINTSVSLALTKTIPLSGVSRPVVALSPGDSAALQGAQHVIGPFCFQARKLPATVQGLTNMAQVEGHLKTVVGRLMPTGSDNTMSLLAAPGAPLVLRMGVANVMQCFVSFRGALADYANAISVAEYEQLGDRWSYAEVMMPSQHRVLRLVTQCIYTTLLNLFPPSASSMAAVTQNFVHFLRWLKAYQKLFDTPCSRCQRYLHDGLPPTWRDFRNPQQVYHQQCRH